MTDYIQYLEGLTILSIVVLFFVVVKIKKGLKSEIVDPEIEVVNDKIAQLSADITFLKANDQRLSDKLEEQFNEVKEKLSTNTESLAKMQGTLDLIVKQLVKWLNKIRW